MLKGFKPEEISGLLDSLIGGIAPGAFGSYADDKLGSGDSSPVDSPSGDGQ